jgi:hypothetical protein
MVLDDLLFKFERLVHLVEILREKDLGERKIASFSLIVDENPTILFTVRFYHNYREVVIGQHCQPTHKSGGRGGIVHSTMMVDYCIAIFGSSRCGRASLKPEGWRDVIVLFSTLKLQ